MLVHGPLLLISLSCLLPFVLVVAASFTDETTITNQGYALWPQKFSLVAYQYVLSDPSQIFSAYGVTLTVTLVGTTTSMIIMSMLAYALSRQQFLWRRPLSFYVFFTLLFNGGLVPFYVLVTRYLQLGDTLGALILPYLVTPFNVLLLRTFFRALPADLFDAARIDGAGEWRIFVQIALPLAKPALATVSLFVILLYWNDYFMALLFTSNNPNLLPMQYLLYALITDAQQMAISPEMAALAPPMQSARMAEAVLAIGPVALAALFVQRYFVRGITLGALRE
jgi:putative aldouronate transport system permease protein